MIVRNLYTTNWGDKEFCTGVENSIMCYFQPITNCTVTDEDIQRAFNNDTEFTSSTHAHVHNFTELALYPTVQYVFSSYNFQLNFMSPTIVHNILRQENLVHYSRWYWRIQAATFIVRLNERTINWIRDYEKENCKECKNEYDISLYIRHGDKHLEMKLVDADVYKDATKLLTSLNMKKNYSIYVNGDDQESIDIVHSLPYDVVSFNRTRNNAALGHLRRQRHIGLISMADIYDQIRADHCVGTIRSNWCQVIYSLKMTVAMKSDGFIFDVGKRICMTHSNCVSRGLVEKVKWVQ